MEKRRLAVLLVVWSNTGCLEKAYRDYLSLTPSDAGPVCAPIQTVPSLCNRAGWCWDQPAPHGNTYYALWAAGPTSVWATSASGGLTHFDGTSWGAVASPTEQHLRGLWGTSDTDLWAVGEFATLLHRDCTGWTVDMNPPGLADFATLRGVFGTGTDDVWTVGDDGAFHWDGHQWDAQAWPGTGLFGLQAVWGDGPSNYWAVGTQGVAAHFDGTGWTAESAAPAPLFGVWGSAGEVWAAGQGGVFHRDAKGVWTRPLRCDATTFRAVWGTTAGDLWASGSGGALWHSSGGEVPADCTGAIGSWSPVSSSTAADLLAGWSLGPQTGWTAGLGGTLVALSNGSAQTQLGGLDTLYDTLWVGGGTVLAGGPRGFFSRQADGTWVPESTTPRAPGRVTAMSGQSPNDVWAVDDSDDVWHRGATGWTVAARLRSFAGSAVFESSSGAVWVAGTNGAIYAAGPGTPASFVLQAGGLPPVYALSGSLDGTQLWAGGGAGALFAGARGTWTPIPSGTNSDIFSLWADPGGSVLWAVGLDGSIAGGAPSAITTQDATPTIATLHAVAGTSAANVWAVGEQGKLLSYDPTTQAWHLVPSGTGNALYALAADPSGGIWLAGERGTVLHHP